MTMTRRVPSTLILCLLAGFLVGCAAQTMDAGPRAQLANVTGNFEAVVSAVDRAYQRGDLTDREFLDLHEDLARGKRILDDARFALEHDRTETTAEKLQVVRSLIRGVRSTLEGGDDS